MYIKVYYESLSKANKLPIFQGKSPFSSPRRIVPGVKIIELSRAMRSRCQPVESLATCSNNQLVCIN